jgi:UDP-galactopyranose mutase
LIVGAGLFGSVFAQQCKEHGKSVLIIDKRNHIGGNCYTKKIHDIDVHQYGPHIFHTNSDKVWNYVNRFAKFNNFINSPVAKYYDKLYSLPFNMWTFNQMWGVQTPEEAKTIIKSQQYVGPINNLEDQAKALVGYEIYQKLIKGYTTKQWNKDPKFLSPSIIKRLPVRYEFNNNYFNDKYQGIPIEGYTKLFENLLEDIPLELETDYFKKRDYYNSLAKNIVYTGPIDKFFDYEYGKLEYRSLKFEHAAHEVENIQGCAVVNYTTIDIPYTRTIEHKHFNPAQNKWSIVTKEYPENYNETNEPYYPINDEQNQDLYIKYNKLGQMHKNIFGGRLAEYKYYNMDQVVASALKSVYNIVISS